MPSPKLLDAYKKIHGHEWLARSYDFPEMEEEEVKKDERYWLWGLAAVVFLGLALVNLGFSVGP